MNQSRKRRIVTIGSGTGSFALLSGLGKYPVELSAIVSMADNGGSTGVLRDELGVLPPGDIRQCLVALSPAGHDLRELLNHRFDEGRLKGHAFGNIFLSALEKETGSFLEGVKVAERVLNIRGRVIPITGESAHLVMELGNGEKIYGEEAIENGNFQETGMKRLYFDPEISVNPEVLSHINEADVVVIGPGTFYGGILPNLVFPEVSKALQESNAQIIVPINLTNKHGHTSGFRVEDYVKEFEAHIGKGRIDTILVNNKDPQEELLERYRSQEGEDALVCMRDKKLLGRIKRPHYVFADLIDERKWTRKDGDALASTRSFIRHDSDKLARAILEAL